MLCTRTREHDAVSTMCRGGLVVTVLLLAALCAQAEICPTIDIRNNVANLNKLKNCTKIVGNLQIVLIDNIQNESVYSNYSFPKLTEITGYLLFFKVAKLETLGQLFPNLAVIRGAELFNENALVIYKMNDLEEIGLVNLMYIPKGNVLIHKSLKLCYATTIDWKAMGTKLNNWDVDDKNRRQCPSCPDECKGKCWNGTTCQRDRPQCHEECIDCTKPNSPKKCIACKNYMDGNTCVPTCPPEKYHHEMTSSCVTKAECLKIPREDWFTFQRSCIKTCPEGYNTENRTCTDCKTNNTCRTVCSTAPVNRIEVLRNLLGCTHYNGSLEITGIENVTDAQLEKYLGQIREINGTLKIYRTNGINNLYFFKELTVIRKVDDAPHAVFIYENKNLQKLFGTNSSLKSIEGGISFHDNPQLCLKEIDTLAKKINITYGETDVSKYSNGDMAACSIVNVTIKELKVEAKSAKIVFEYPSRSENESFVGAVFFYTENAWNNASVYESRGVCIPERWKSVFITDKQILIQNLIAFTNYSFYIKILRNVRDGTLTSQSNVMNFTTLSDQPEDPQDMEVKGISQSSVVLNWTRPTKINGVLHQYNLTIQKINPYYVERNYCLNPVTEPKILTVPSTPRPQNNLINTNPNCACSHTEMNIFTQDEFISCLKTLHKQRNCEKMSYFIEEDAPGDAYLDKTMVIGMPEKIELKTDNDVYTIQPERTFIEISHLEHYTMYAFYLSACNEPEKEGNSQCSGFTFAYGRTLKDEHADDITTFSGKVVGNDIELEWMEPEHPNEQIYTYTIRYRLNVEHSIPVTYCITREQHIESNFKYKLTNLAPGRYTVQVRALSSAGQGRYTPEKLFDTTAPSSYLVEIIVGSISLVGLILLSIGVLFLIRYRKKKAIDDIRLIQSINSNYEGITYQADNWEIDRDDIELLKDLGQGTFGNVYQGYIKSLDMPCAVKTVKDSFSLHEKIEFLNEASVMKSLSTCNHVVKLLGVVSKGQPPLVLMELMERGDLKSYLVRIRNSSQNITSNELYRMAIEIADGMAYLGAKKFVHRDLAARNCMVSGGRTVKVGDFGMTRDIYENDYYRKGTRGLLPVRWMAPESLADGVFTTDSDVWSYGITLWEMATLAEQPYQGLANEQVLHFVVSKGKLQRPPECPDLLFEIMDACWATKPSKRPTFMDIIQRLECHVGEDFRCVSFYHSREVMEYTLNGQEMASVSALPSTSRGSYTRFHASDEEVSLYTEQPKPSPKFSFF